MEKRKLAELKKNKKVREGLNISTVAKVLEENYNPKYLVDGNGGNKFNAEQKQKYSRNLFK